MKYIKSFLFMFLAINIISCSDSDEYREIDPAFTAYISAFTSGIISNSDVITIRLAEAVSGIELNEPIENELFDFSPNIDGQAFWIDEMTIEFRPEDRLPTGQQYNVNFELGDVLDVPDDLETFGFSFQILEQAVFVEFTGMKAYDDEDLSWQQVKGNVQTSDFAEAEVIEEMFGIDQEGRKRFISWSHSVGGRKHEFQIDSVSRKEERSSIIMNWDGDALDIDDGEMSFDIPPLGEFLVMSMHVVQEPNQSIQVLFSDPLKKDQNLDGLIYLSSQADIRLVIESNMVFIYPQKKLIGDHEVVIESFVVNSIGYQLMEGSKLTLAFTSHKPAIEIMGKGVIVPNSDGVIMPFKSVNLTGVDFKIVKIYENNVAQFLQDNLLDGNSQLRRVGRLVKKGSINLKSNTSINYSTWNNFYLDLSEYINTEPGAIYRVSLSFRPSQSLYTCDVKVEDDLGDISLLEDPEFAEYDEPVDRWYYYDDYYYDYNSDYSWRERENPCNISYYLRGNNVVSRNILASDLGIIAKKGSDDKVHVFVTDLKSAEPISGVKLDLYNYQQQLIQSSQTDASGMVIIDLNKQIPFLMIAKMDNQRGYLRLDDGTSRSVSMFNVGGKHLKKGLNGYIYGERGVWRPGDSLFLSFILEDVLGKLPKNHPVVMELYTPENKLYHKKVQTRNVNGFYDFRTKTDREAPTGNWTAKIKVGGSEFFKRVKIESIKPNRLKINLDFGDDILEKGSNIQGELYAEWLHGAKASNLKADIEMSLSSVKTDFKDYPGFYFDDPSKEFSSEEKKVYDGSINEYGEADFFPKISVKKPAPGMLNARFVTRVFERGGDFSIDRYDITYSPYKNYVGVKMPEGTGWNGAIFSDEKTLVPIVTVDQKGNPVSRKNLKVEIFRVDWRWWWEHEDRYSLSRYVSNRSDNLIASGVANTVNGKGTYEMSFRGDHYGRFFIVVKDVISGHSTGQLFYLTYSSWWNDPASSNPGGAEMLSFSTDKKEYEVGEDVKVQLPAFTEGRALITVENGSKILEEFWVTAAGSAEGITFEAKTEMAPNVYVNISLIQPHSKTSNNLPIRLYGIEKIKVVDKTTVLNPEISMLKDLEPEKKVSIKVSEKNGKAMTYTVAVVDDGLLDLTRFKTPDPWSEFFSLQSLGVKTWDIYPYVLSDFGMNANGLLAIGGDEAGGNANDKKANRFKPVVKFFGPFELGSGDVNEHEFIMPNYVGSVRTMVVAGQDGAYGAGDFTSKVKKPVMILPTVPRVIGPGENITIPVSVFVMDESVKNVKVEMKANSKFIVIGDKTRTVSFSEVGEEMVYFKVKAKEVIGFGKFDFKATGGSYSSNYDVEIDIRPANPLITKIYDGSMEANTSWSKEFTSFGVAGTGKATLELTTLPALGLDKHLKYLMGYPYGCIEQTTSSVFAQLFLNELLELNNEKLQIIQENVNAGITRIASFQTSSGGLSYWPGEGYVSEWGTNYAGHFMIEAKVRGYALPPGFLNSWIRCQKQLANSWSRKVETRENKYSELTQAYRLYTLAKAERPAMGAMNRMMQLNNLSKSATWRLAGAYALIGKEKVARNLISNLDYEMEDYRELSYTYGSRRRDMAMVLEVMVDIKDPNTRDLLMDLADIMNKSNWLSTQETAYMLMSISKAAGGSSGVGKNVKATITIGGNKTVVNSNKPFYQIELPVKNNAGTSVVVQNSGEKLLFSRIISEGIPLAGQETEGARNMSMSVNFTDMGGNMINPKIIEQGKDFVIEVTVRNPGTRVDYKEMVLNQIFPSGWEIRNSRMDKADGEVADKKVRYQDIRDDRVYTFFDLKRHEQKTFKILLNATYTGRFYLPAFLSGAMYDESISANSKGMWVEVVNSTVQ